MSTENLIRALRAVHELDVQQAPKQHRLQTAQCLSLPRLLTGRADWTSAEQQHVAGCPYCQLILKMGEEEAAASAGPIILRFSRHPQTAAAAGHEPLVLCAEAGGLTAEFFEDNGQYVLELRSRDPAWDCRKVRFTLAPAAGGEAVTGEAVLAQGVRTRGAEKAAGGEAVTGELVLQRDPAGWYAAQATFNAQELYDRIGGQCQVTIEPLAE